MTLGVTDRHIELDTDTSTRRRGEASTGVSETEAELVWARHLAQFGLSGHAEPLLERKVWA